MIVIKKGRYINPLTRQDEIIDIVVDRHRIEMTGMHISFREAEVIEAEGMIVAPGFVDIHAHFRDPGPTFKEDIQSGVRAAAKGGYTSVVLMANTDPPVDNVKTLEYVLYKGKYSDINVASCATVTLNMSGEEVVDMEALAEAGAAGFTDDGNTIVDKDVLYRAMKKAGRVGKPICLHEENPRYVANPGINRGYASEMLKCRGASRRAEISMIKRDLDIALHTGATVVIQHVSTKEGVELIRQAKLLNPLIYAEATPHHFSLTEETLVEKGNNAKVNPPLRTEEDRLAIIEGLCDGTIDVIATDHAPHTRTDKWGKVTAVPSGMIGLETALSVGLKYLVEPGYLTITDLIMKMSVNPARLFNLNAGNIGLYQKADIVVFDPNETYEVGDFASKSQNSPYKGEILPGVVHYTICNGKIVYNKNW